MQQSPEFFKKFAYSENISNFYCKRGARVHNKDLLVMRERESFKILEGAFQSSCGMREWKEEDKAHFHIPRTSLLVQYVNNMYTHDTHILMHARELRHHRMLATSAVSRV